MWAVKYEITNSPHSCKHLRSSWSPVATVYNLLFDQNVWGIVITRRLWGVVSFTVLDWKQHDDSCWHSSSGCGIIMKWAKEKDVSWSDNPTTSMEMFTMNITLSANLIPMNFPIVTFSMGVKVSYRINNFYSFYGEGFVLHYEPDHNRSWMNHWFLNLNQNSRVWFVISNRRRAGKAVKSWLSKLVADLSEECVQNCLHVQELSKIHRTWKLMIFLVIYFHCFLKLKMALT